MAAVYALHRVNSHVPMERVLPPDFRNYWISLDKLKKEDTQGLWPAPGADPFVPQSKPSAEEENLKQQAQAQRQLEKQQREDSINLPTIQLSEEHRQTIEKLIKQAQYEEQQEKMQDEDFDKDSLFENGVPKNKHHRAITQELDQLGFAKEHIYEGLVNILSSSTNETDSQQELKSELLSWLCLHVPESDLPNQFKSKTFQLVSSQHDSVSLAQSYMVQRLTEYGFNKESVKEAMALGSFDEDTALFLLIKKLKSPSDENSSAAAAAATTTPLSPPLHVSERFSSSEIESAQATVDEEIMALESIFGVSVSTEPSLSSSSSSSELLLYPPLALSKLFKLSTLELFQTKLPNEKTPDFPVLLPC